MPRIAVSEAPTIGSSDAPATTPVTPPMSAKHNTNAKERGRPGLRGDSVTVRLSPRLNNVANSNRGKTSVVKPKPTDR